VAAAVAAAGNLSRTREFCADLTVDAELDRLCEQLSQAGGLDILVHAAGVVHQNRMEDANVGDLDVQYATNVRAPYLLTKRLLPLLTGSRGQVVFINSSAGFSAGRPGIGQYAATKHALRAIAESLRAELNPKGVRVISVYLGRTAGPLQERLFRQEGKTYRPERLLQPEDVASVLLHTLALPPTAEVTDIHIRPMLKPDS
jgi:NAD(P)-dependent dehydrogenase (short-subunit alcohol dehydrogenase family)